MRYLLKASTVIGCCMMLVACGSHLEYTNLKKEGTEYTVGKNVHFYYPNQYELDSVHTDNEVVHFRNGDEGIFCSVSEDETDNHLQDRDELYIGELEQKGASNFVVSKPILESGLTVYEITGSYIETGLRFKHIVYFTDTHTYVYGYVATAEDYEKNIKDITVFLQSIVIEESIEE